MSSPYSAGSAASTSDSNEPECESSPNAKPTPKHGQSSLDIGPEPPATRTLPGSTVSGSGVMAFNLRGRKEGARVEMTQAASPRASSGGSSRTYIAFVQNQRDEVREVRIPGALAAEPGMKQQTYLLTSPAEASPAKTSPSPETGPDSRASDQDSSSRQPELQTLFSETGDGSSLRMFPDYLAPMEELTSGSYSRRWPTSGFTTSPGELWTADTSECPNGGGEYSSLPDVLEATVPERFYLSQKAAAGILRRAERRGRELPPALDRALRTLSTEGRADPMTTQPRQTTSSQETA